MLQPVQVRSGQAAIQAFMGMADIDHWAGKLVWAAASYTTAVPATDAHAEHLHLLLLLLLLLWLIRSSYFFCSFLFKASKGISKVPDISCDIAA
jgi:hypothetical protein